MPSDLKPMTPMKPMAPMKPMEPMTWNDQDSQPWWPGDLGQPNSTGSQNDTRYAYFGDSHRLAIQRDGQVKVYDTGDRRINGYAQQQGSDNAMVFSSDNGEVAESDLRLLS